MKKILFLLLFINIYSSNFCQLIKGFILDRNTKEPINFASVYFNGTFAGTNTNDKGYFELDGSKFRSMPLSVSALGYYTETLTDYLNLNLFRIYMIPRVFELNEINVTDKNLEKARKRNMRLFRAEFLGLTPNAKYCTILNEKDIRFNYYWDRDTLRAYSREPILIRNASLGYEIKFYLDEFKIDRRTGNLSFSGNILFKDDMASDTLLSQYFHRKRMEAFLGSRMQFFRALWAKDIKSAGFSVFKEDNVTPDYEEIVESEDSMMKYLGFDEKLFIYYNNYPFGTIKLLYQGVPFDRNGYFDPLGVIWEGDISSRRIADWLPYEYEFTAY
ncbi:MAG: carboxypeptidase-like regulatory domain-containing protein [Bacteroidales bacterium]|nr:carboxypeptidase-like regulatory domain-containing protein [Bacteroidales bacterium]